MPALQWQQTLQIDGDVRSFDAPADGGNIISREFCPTCGAPVYSRNSGMKALVFLRASSLDDPDVFEPQMIVYAARAPAWAVLDSRLPAF